MNVIRTTKYAMLRRLGWLALVLVLLCALPFVAFADKPPKELYQHVIQTAVPIHQGECNVQSMGVKDTPCLIFYNAELGRTWVVLFDQDKGGNYHVTHVVMAQDDKEVIAWCRADVCM